MNHHIGKQTMHQLFSLLLLTSTLKTATLQCPVTSLPADWISVNVPGSDYCYAIGKTKVNAVTARSKCWSVFRGVLARFHDVTNLRNLARKISINTDKIWIDSIRKKNHLWIWSDGSKIDSAVLGEFLDDDLVSGLSCGALANSASPKFSKWTNSLCTSNREFLCQAAKLKTDLGNCVNATFRYQDKCFVTLPDPMTFESAVEFCENFHNGKLAALENTEIASAMVNYVELTAKMSENVRVWLDIVWDEENGRWSHQDGRKITFYEKNWLGPQPGYTEGKSHVVMDQSAGWKWKATQSESEAHFLCEINSIDQLEGKAVGPNIGTDLEKVVEHTEGESSSNGSLPDETTMTTTTIATSDIVLGLQTLALIGAGIAVVIFVLIIIIAVLCYKKETCCWKKQKVHVHSDGFGTPVSFNFMNPDYQGITVANRTQSRGSDTPLRELPHPPHEEDQTYATIDGEDSPDTQNVDLQAPQPTGYASLSLARSTTSRDQDFVQASTASLPRTQHVSRESLASRDPASNRADRRAMTSFGARNTSPYHAKMGISKREASDLETSALQYAELAFGTTDEDEQFHVEESNSAYEQHSQSMTQHDRNHSDRSTGSMIQHRFNDTYPEFATTREEQSPFILSPDSPQFPFHR